jgi:hypothetical protein
MQKRLEVQSFAVIMNSNVSFLNRCMFVSWLNFYLRSKH